MAKIEPFEKYTQRYEAWFRKHASVYRVELAAMQRIMDAGLGVEIGVGTGRFAIPLSIPFGVEPSPNAGKLAKQGGVQVVSGVGEFLPLRSAFFDYVVMITAICFMDDLWHSFAEVKRILRPHGALLIGFVDRDSPLGRYYLQHKNENVFYRDAIFYNPEEIVAMLKKSGFAVRQSVQTVFHELAHVTDEEPIEQGYGRGAFVVMKAVGIK